LDPLGAEEIHNLAGSLKKEGRTIIMVEHNIDELAKVADRIVVMDHGEILMDAPTRDVLSKVEFLKGLGIYPPQVTQTAYALQNLGVTFKQMPITIEEGLEAFSRIGQHD
jgi:ABC-type multidrug transport system ATPase subunit